MADMSDNGRDDAPDSGEPPVRAPSDHPTPTVGTHSTARPAGGHDPVAEPDGAAGAGSARELAPISERVRAFVRAAGEDPMRLVEALVSFTAVVLATGLIIRTLHFDLLWKDTTPTGGDMGAHVWGPRYLLDNLLPQFRLSGWTPDWYSGFPAYQFYMVIPSLLIVLLHVGIAWYGAVIVGLLGVAATAAAFVKERLYPHRYLVLSLSAAALILATPMPYNRAFKLVTGIGLICLPLACWAFAKLADLPFPAPPLAAVAALLFAYNREPLYNNTGNIIGGNFHSTMAGEFAFSVSLTLSVLYLGVAVRGLKTGKHRALAAALFALAGLCHLIPAFFVLACTGALLVVHPDRQRFRWLATMVPVAGLLTAWWVVPFWWRRDYVNDMGWERLPLPGAETSADGLKMAGDQGSVWYYLLPPGLRWLLVAALIGVIVSVIRRYSVGMVLGIAWAAVMVAFSVMPQYRLWNARLLPFMYLSVALLAAIGVAEVIRVLGVAGSGRPEKPLRLVTLPLTAVAVLGVMIYTVLPLSGLFDDFRVLGWRPVEQRAVQAGDQTVTESYLNAPGAVHDLFGLFDAEPPIPFRTTSLNPVGGWAEWNYSGLEAKTESPAGCSAEGSTTPCKSGGWPEYRDLMATMAGIGADPDLGCGRAFWEYEKDRVNGYGTPMAPMLLPYWTDGCIGSQEGLYFESSATVPHHFLMQSELSTGPSNPQRGLPYPSFDIDAGVRHLQLLGVRYYLASTPAAIEAASGHPDLSEVAVSGPWHVYLVAGSDLVAPLRFEPVVAEGIDESQHGWLPTAIAWFLDPESLDVMYTHTGPDDWERVDAHPVPDEQRELVRWMREQLGERGPVDEVPDLPRTELPEIEVSDIDQNRDSISFTVSEPGVPVLVRTSYFPNWVAEGADGPYRVAPNLMVVVPTDTEVTLRYSRTPVDLAAGAMSLVGLVLLVLLARSRRVDVPPLRPGRLSMAIDDLLTLPVAKDRPEADGADESAGGARVDGPGDQVDSLDVFVLDEDLEGEDRGRSDLGGEPDVLAAGRPDDLGLDPHLAGRGTDLPSPSTPPSATPTAVTTEERASGAEPRGTGGD